MPLADSIASKALVYLGQRLRSEASHAFRSTGPHQSGNSTKTGALSELLRANSSLCVIIPLHHLLYYSQSTI